MVDQYFAVQRYRRTTRNPRSSRGECRQTDGRDGQAAMGQPNLVSNSSRACPIRLRVNPLASACAWRTGSRARESPSSARDTAAERRTMFFWSSRASIRAGVAAWSPISPKAPAAYALTPESSPLSSFTSRSTLPRSPSSPRLRIAHIRVGLSLSSSSSRRSGMASGSPSLPSAIAAVERTVAPLPSRRIPRIGPTALLSPNLPSPFTMRTVVPSDLRYLASARRSRRASSSRRATTNSTRHFRNGRTHHPPRKCRRISWATSLASLIVPACSTVHFVASGNRPAIANEPSGISGATIAATPAPTIPETS